MTQQGGWFGVRAARAHTALHSVTFTTKTTCECGREAAHTHSAGCLLHAHIRKTCTTVLQMILCLCRQVSAQFSRSGVSAPNVTAALMMRQWPRRGLWVGRGWGCRSDSWRNTIQNPIWCGFYWTCSQVTGQTAEDWITVPESLTGIISFDRNNVINFTETKLKYKK